MVDQVEQRLEREMLLGSPPLQVGGARETRRTNRARTLTYGAVATLIVLSLSLVLIILLNLSILIPPTDDAMYALEFPAGSAVEEVLPADPPTMKTPNVVEAVAPVNGAGSSPQDADNVGAPETAPAPPTGEDPFQTMGTEHVSFTPWQTTAMAPRNVQLQIDVTTDNAEACVKSLLAFADEARFNARTPQELQPQTWIADFNDLVIQNLQVSGLEALQIERIQPRIQHVELDMLAGQLWPLLPQLNAPTHQTAHLREGPAVRLRFDPTTPTSRLLPTEYFGDLKVDGDDEADGDAPWQMWTRLDWSAFLDE